MSLYTKARLVVSLFALILVSSGRDVFAACAIVDDMESYTPWAGLDPEIYQIWIDGVGDCLPDAGNNTGCTVEANYEIPGGAGVSMQYDYDNDGNAYNPCTLEQGTRDHKWSVARAELDDLLSEIGSDWTVAGDNVLSLAFYGETGNEIEEMWIKLEDNAGGNDKVFYGDNPGEDPNNMAVESWHTWIIDLNSFTPEVNLADVNAISIGIGREGATVEGGSGTIYFDEIFLCSAEYTTIYVNAAAGGDNTGLNWHDALTSLQDAIDVPTVDRILVAEGTYYPTAKADGTGERSRAFLMRNDVEIYGGFPSAGDPNFEDRDPAKYTTVLSGDIGTPGEPNDNCYHVLYNWYTAAIDRTTLLDGFTITAGNANGTYRKGLGAGIYNNLSDPTVANCIFTANTALYGGAVYNDSSDPMLDNCVFVANSALYGGAIYNEDGSNPILTNCTFAANPTQYDAAISNKHSSPNITNSILWANPAPNDLQIYNTGSSTPTVTYTNVQGGWTGTGNTRADPLFVRDPNDGGDGWDIGDNDDLGDLRLRPPSPCIDAGNNGALPPDPNNQREILDGDCNDTATVDMGAHEFDFTALGDTAKDCDVDAEDFAILAARWKDTLCNEANNFCDLADVDQGGVVDFRDVLILAENWLTAAK